MKKNNYVVGYKYGKNRIEIVFPSYQSMSSDLGYYWNLGLSLGIGGTSKFDLHIGLILGWIKIVIYK